MYVYFVHLSVYIFLASFLFTPFWLRVSIGLLLLSPAITCKQKALPPVPAAGASTPMELKPSGVRTLKPLSDIVLLNVASYLCLYIEGSK